MADKVYEYMDWPRIEAIVYGEEDLPREILGAHPARRGILIQCYFPGAQSVEVHIKDSGKVYKMTREDEAGFFAALLPGRTIPDYEFLVVREDGLPEVVEDPYAFRSMLSPQDEKAFCEGVAYDIYKKMGAHPMQRSGVRGIYFSVWAPNAAAVRVVGDFNMWDGREHMMHRSGGSGIFELFIPAARPGDMYKYELLLKGGARVLRTDPYAMERECGPGTASVVPEAEKFVWSDGAWMRERDAKTGERPLSVCEIRLTEWGRSSDGGYLSYGELAEKIAAYARKMHFTHVELSPVMEFGEDSTGGYATSGYFAPTSRFGKPSGFKYFVNCLHRMGIGVILDWTPAHFPAFDGGMQNFDGTCLYEYADPARGVHPFWGTKLFNYGSPMVKDFLISNALYWIECFHIDGLRMDDVDAMLYLDYGRSEGQWRPNIYGSNENLEAIELLKHLNSIVKKAHPDVLLIAQEDGLWPELTGEVDDTHMGFDYKWNNGWTGSILDYLRHDTAYRAAHHDELTTSMLYAYCENYVLTLNSRDVEDGAAFAESLPGTDEEKMALARAAYGYLVTHPGRKMIAPGERMDEGLETFLRELLKIYRERPALWELDGEPGGFEWIQLMEADKQMLVFLRKTERAEDTLLVVCNFSGESRAAYVTGVPYSGKYKEIINSDHAKFGGGGFVNPRVKRSKNSECNERADSLTFRIAPLSISVFAYQGK